MRNHSDHDENLEIKTDRNPKKRSKPREMRYTRDDEEMMSMMDARDNFRFRR